MGGLVQLLARGFFVRAVEFDFEVFANMDGFDAAIAHVFEGGLHGLALRIKDRFLGRHNNFGFHRKKIKSGSNKFPEMSAVERLILRHRSHSGENFFAALLNGQKELLKFLQPPFGILLGQAREFAPQRDKIPLASEHQFVLFHLDDGHAAFAGEDFYFRNQQ